MNSEIKCMYILLIIVQLWLIMFMLFQMNGSNHNFIFLLFLPTLTWSLCIVQRNRASRYNHIIKKYMMPFSKGNIYFSTKVLMEIWGTLMTLKWIIDDQIVYNVNFLWRHSGHKIVDNFYILMVNYDVGNNDDQNIWSNIKYFDDIFQAAQAVRY